MTADLSDGFFKQIYQDEEDENIVLSIREEIMDRVMDECYKSYLKKQTVRFIVQCAYDAMVKFLSFNFYYHPEVPDLTHPIWIPDEPIEPSPKDTWACDAVPIRPIDFEEEIEQDIIFEMETMSTGPSIKTSVSNRFSSIEDSKCCMCLEHVCTCLVPPEELVKRLGSYYDKPCPSKIKFSPKSSKHSDIGKRSVPDTITSTDLLESDSEVLSRQQSGRESTPGETTTEGFDSYVKLDSNKGEIKKKRKPKQPRVQEAELEVPDNIVRGSLADLVALPPIRVNSRFHSKPVEKPKSKKN